MPVLEIHALPVGAGALALSPLPGRGGAYAGDLEHLVAWEPALVLSMTTLPEMEAGGAGNLGADLRREGIRWIHLPIEDFGTPPPDTDAAWPEASQAALSVLQGGGRALIHCRGGCGRSGMAMLRLMIEAGETPDAALARLRAIRPCAVETDAQMAWAMRHSEFD